MTVNATYNFENQDDEIMLTNHITSFVTGFGGTSFIRSDILLTVYAGIPTDMVMLECFSYDILESVLVLIDAASKYLLMSFHPFFIIYCSTSPLPSYWFCHY